MKRNPTTPSSSASQARPAFDSVHPERAGPLRVRRPAGRRQNRQTHVNRSAEPVGRAGAALRALVLEGLRGGVFMASPLLNRCNYQSMSMTTLEWNLINILCFVILI